jgi:precorrin-2 dehydrogenase/sirohydrochlorin ferrochelatase
MAYYPILMDLDGKRALVVGGGEVAERKIKTLVSCGARVDVVSLDLCPGLEGLERDGRIRRVGREFEETHLDGAVLVIAATDDAGVNRRVGAAAKARGIPVNAVDQPADCTFILPAVIRRGDLLLAVSTSGRSPALARRIREELEERFGPEYAGFLALMGRVRELVLDRGEGQKDNQEVFRRLVRSDLLEAVGLKDWSRAAGILASVLETGWSGEDVRRIVEAGSTAGEPSVKG